MRKSLFAFLTGTICIAIISLAVPANAFLTDMGNGALYDDLSGLYVLSNATQFCNMTYSQQVAHIDSLNSGASSQIHGAWRMATLDDFGSFSSNFWLNPADITQITPTRTSYDAIYDEIRYFYNLRLDWLCSPGYHAYVYEVFRNTANSGWVEDYYDRGDAPDSYQHADMGALVVADPIPEPATMILLGTGLVGMVGMIRRMKSERQ